MFLIILTKMGSPWSLSYSSVLVYGLGFRDLESLGFGVAEKGPEFDPFAVASLGRSGPC